MKKLLIGLLLGGCVAIGSYVAVNYSAAAQCENWLRDAKAAEEKGLNALVITTLTLYFNSTTCRSAQDADAVHLLTKSRKHVPLPSNAHLGQAIVLAKQGLQLGEDTNAGLEIASAYLVHGKWAQARAMARQFKTTQSGLIALAASVALAEDKEIEFDFKQLEENNGSTFSLLLAHRLLLKRSSILAVDNTPVEDQNGEAKLPLAAPANESMEQIVAYIADPTQDEMILPVAMAVAATMSFDDLATATSLLTAKGKLVVATIMLDQPDRAMTSQLLIRLAHLMWMQGDLKSLDGEFLSRKAQGMMPAEVIFAVCLAKRRGNQICPFEFDEAQYQERHGAYAASKWAVLLEGLSGENLQSGQLIDALNDMGTLLDGNGLAHQFKASLLSSLGEKALAHKYERLAEGTGYKGIMSFGAMPHHRQLSCDANDQLCISKTLSSFVGDLGLWRQAVEAGFKPNLYLAQQLREHSPEEAVLWRIVLAQALLRAGDDESMVEALIILRPVLTWVPSHSAAQLLAATAYFYFGDTEAVFIALSSAVAHRPNRAVETLRLAVGFYEDGNKISANQLVHWWQGVTLLEMKARNLTVTHPEGEQLLRERLSLLAAFAEGKNDIDLSIATYEKLLQQNPNNHMALNNLAYHLLLIHN
mgnify:CR=1 FL=1